MSQGFGIGAPVHHNTVAPVTLAPSIKSTAPASWRVRRADPASRRAHRAYDGLSSSTVGLELGLSVVVGILGGIWIDGKFGSQPWGMLAGLGFGIAAGFRGLMRAIRRAERAGAKQDALFRSPPPPARQPMASPSIQRIERLNYVIAGVWVRSSSGSRMSRAIALGITCGSLLTCLNFLILRKLVVKWTSDAAAGRSGTAPLLMLPKMVGLMGAVAVCVLLLPIDVIAFAVGYSIFILSITIEATYSALRTQPEPPTSGNSEGQTRW